MVLLSSKSLDNLPPRIIRFRLRMDKYDYTIRHVAGKELYTADTLSRVPSPMEGGKPESDAEEVELYVESVTKSLPVTEGRLEEYRKAQDLPKSHGFLQSRLATKAPDREALDSVLEGEGFPDSP